MNHQCNFVSSFFLLNIFSNYSHYFTHTHHWYGYFGHLMSFSFLFLLFLVCLKELMITKRHTRHLGLLSSFELFPSSFFTIILIAETKPFSLSHFSFFIFLLNHVVISILFSYAAIVLKSLLSFLCTERTRTTADWYNHIKTLRLWERKGWEEKYKLTQWHRQQKPRNSRYHSCASFSLNSCRTWTSLSLKDKETSLRVFNSHNTK